MLQVNGLVKRYPGFSLEVESFKIQLGAIVGLIGPNGAGKTTLMRAILGIVSRDAGEVVYNGRPIPAESSGLRERIAYVPEQPVLYEAMTVRELLRFAGRLYPEWSETRSAELLHQFGVDPAKKIRALSNGMRTKLLLTMALAHAADMLFLDEPTTGLDPMSRDDFWSFLREAVSHDRLHALLISSHQLDDIEEMCQRVIFLKDGRVVLDEPKETLLEDWKKVTCVGPCAGTPLPDVIATTQGTDGLGIFLKHWSDQHERLLAQAGAQQIQVSPVKLKDLFLAVCRGK